MSGIVIQQQTRLDNTGCTNVSKWYDCPLPVDRDGVPFDESTPTQFQVAAEPTDCCGVGNETYDVGVFDKDGNCHAVLRGNYSSEDQHDAMLVGAQLLSYGIDEGWHPAAGYEFHYGTICWWEPTGK